MKKISIIMIFALSFLTVAGCKNENYKPTNTEKPIKQEDIKNGNLKFKFIDKSSMKLPLDHDFGQDSAIGDVDNDGDLDIIIPVFKGQNRLMINDGSGNFKNKLEHLVIETDASVHAKLVDINNDNYLDLIFANEGKNRILLNKGGDDPGFFEEIEIPQDITISESVATGDVDGDGDKDIIFGNMGINFAGEQNTLLINEGNGVFINKTSSSLPVISDPTYQVLLFDIDSDGDLDIFSANKSTQNILLVNNGEGVYSNATSTNLPADTDKCTAATYGDVDGDGDFDLVTISFDNTPNRILLNDGNGIFTYTSEGNFVPARGNGDYDGDLADIDNDNDLDLIIGSIHGGTSIYFNDGNGKFSKIDDILPDDSIFTTYDIDHGDLNGDGFLDLFLTNNGDHPDRIYININPDSKFDDIYVFNILPNHVSIKGEIPIIIKGQNFTDITNVSLGEVPLTKITITQNEITGVVNKTDKAGIVNLNLHTSKGHMIAFPYLFEYDSITEGTLFSDNSSNLPRDKESCNDVITGDVNGDNFDDIIYITETGKNLLYLYNIDISSFVDVTDTNFPATNIANNNMGQSAVLADIDNDGDRDLIIANGLFEKTADSEPGKQNRLYVNNGEGVFTDETDQRIPVDSTYSNGIAAADVNNDGYIDLIFANDGINFIYLNVGSTSPGFFTDVSLASIPQTNVFSRSVGAFDVDGDGDYDLTFSNNGTRNHLWLNDGNGLFTDATADSLPDEMETGGNDTAQITPFYINGKDQPPDLILSRTFASSVLYYINDGTGKFTENKNFQDPDPAKLLYGATGSVIGDFDNDNISDILFSFWIMTPTIRVMHGEENRLFKVKEEMIYPNSTKIGGVAAVDYDKDGDLDIAVAVFGEQNQLFENKTVN